MDDAAYRPITKAETVRSFAIVFACGLVFGAVLGIWVLQSLGG